MEGDGFDRLRQCDQLCPLHLRPQAVTLNLDLETVETELFKLLQIEQFG